MFVKRQMSGEPGEAGAGVLRAHGSAARVPQKDGALGLGFFTNWTVTCRAE